MLFLRRFTMLRKCLFFIACFLFLLSLSAMPTFAKAVNAPGGTVTSADELVAALGGSDAAVAEKNYVMIISDVCLSAPIVITEGSYEIRGAGVEITASYDDNSFFVIGGSDTVKVAIGRSDNDSPDEDILFNGEGNTREGSFIHVLEKGEVSLYKGIRFYNTITSVMGGAIYSDGTVVLYGGTIDKCRSTGSGGAIASRGDLLLPSGNIKDCTAEFGGAVYNEGTVALAGTEITGCSAQKGGALFNTGTLQLVSSTISSCKADQGGCLYNSGEATLGGGQILTCKAEDGEGGGVYNSGKATLKGTYLNENEARLGGNLFNVGTWTIDDGVIQSGKATLSGGNVYNDSTGNLTYKTGSISRGNAKYGGGIFNLGTFTYEKGAFSLNKADVGAGILNEGKMIFCEYPYVDPKNDVAIVVTEDDAHAIEIRTQMKADLIAQLTPYQKTADGYVATYESGLVLLKGEYVKTSASRFTVTSAANGISWVLSDDGTLVEPVPVYHEAWFYIVLFLSFVATVAIMVVGIRFLDKKKAASRAAVAL